MEQQKTGVLLALALSAGAGFLPAIAQDVPPSADIGRLKPYEQPELPDDETTGEASIAALSYMDEVELPEEAKSIMFTLKGINITGMTAFTESEVSHLYSDFIGKEISLDKLWQIAGSLSQYYQQNGYFLSRAHIPPQEIGDEGIITIAVIEGYVGEVVVQEENDENHILKKIRERLLAQRPINLKRLESILLKINDLPGKNYRAVLGPSSENAPQESVRLTLVPTDKRGSGQISFDNHGSRYLGPYQLTGVYEHSFIDLHKTTFAGMMSWQTDELKYGSINHEVYLTPELSMEAYGSYTTAYPGYTLEVNEIESASTTLGLSFKYQFIRQRNKNLLVKLAVEGKNTNSDLLDTPLTRDRVRVARLGLYSDYVDSIGGYNIFDITATRGLDILGSSQADELNLSRAEAEPDFTKLEATVRRLQALSESWAAMTAVSGQWASKPLYSSEEYGYGGQSFGRAFDSSEIAGEQGLSASVELMYNGLGDWRQYNFQPYALGQS